MSWFPFDITEIFQAYAGGEFPTLNQSGEFVLYRPPTRALLPVDGIHVSEFLNQTISKEIFSVTFNQAFAEVAQLCVRVQDNWITPELIRIYSRIHKNGWAHSVECWKEGELAGGLFGLAIGGVFFIESMFSHASDASKVATKYLVDECRRQGFTLIDTQLISPQLAGLGAFEVTDDQFRLELYDGLDVTTQWGKNKYLIAEQLSPPTIETERLLIRGFQKTDAASLYTYVSKPEVNRFTLMSPPVSIEVAERLITGTYFKRYRQGSVDPLAICLRQAPDVVIGSVGCFRPTAVSANRELFYELDSAHWSNGYAREAAQALMNHVFSNCAVERIQTRTVPENTRGEKLSRLLGLTYEGTLRSSMLQNGRFWDLKYYSILRSEWMKRQNDLADLVPIVGHFPFPTGSGLDI